MCYICHLVMIKINQKLINNWITNWHACIYFFLQITKPDLESKVIHEIWCQFSNYNPRQNIDFQCSWSITCMYRNNDLPYQRKKHVCMYSERTETQPIAFFGHTAKRKLERLQFLTSSSFVKIWSACSCEFI